MSAYPAQPFYSQPAATSYVAPPSDQSQQQQQQQQQPSQTTQPAQSSAQPPQQSYYQYPVYAAPMASTTDVAYGTPAAAAYPYQYQVHQPYGATYLQPYQYLQQQQQQQAMYQQQYQNTYHHQQVAMMPTITDPTGQKAPPNIKPKITTTLWEDEGTLCFQVEARGICIARREDNNMINGTKLLNVAGMTRGRRDGMLKGEKSRHVVKAGAMHLKGVWIPYERALDFANREKIIDLLYPLFVTDLKSLLYHPANFARTAQVLNAAEKRKAEFTKQADPKKDTKDEEKKPANQPPSQQSLSGRFSVDRIVSTTPSSTPPATASNTPAAAGKPYYFNEFDTMANAPTSAYVSPTSRISTPVSAPTDAQPYMPQQRYGAPVAPAPYHISNMPQMAPYGQMYQQAGGVPLVSPASSTSGGTATPVSEAAAAPATPPTPADKASPKKETSYE